MGVEIERKFLVQGDDWRAAAGRKLRMRQGYLNGTAERASVRVRTEGDDAFINIKAAVVGSTRAEYEYPIPPEDANRILDTLCIGGVEKTRHYVTLGGLTWEIDEFAGANAGLVVAEIELASAGQAFERPSWLGGEVTDQQRYYNHALALHPYREWGR